MMAASSAIHNATKGGMADLAHGLDHVAHAVRDLDAAAEFYRQLGFTVGARNRHPWGTHNHIVQLPGFFIELLTLAEPDKLGGDGFSTQFAAYARDFAERHEGLALLILESQEAGADVSAFRASGIAASDIMRFEREGKRPDGNTVKVGFSLAFAEDKLSPDIHFATCQQHYPENFWNPEFQKHANGVSQINGVVLVADKPAEQLKFLEAYSGAAAVQIDEDGDRGAGGGYRIELPRGVIDVVTQEAFTHRFGLAAPSPEHGARMAALRFGTTDVTALKSALKSAGLTLATDSNLPAPAGSAVLNADSGAISVPALGAALIFEPVFT
jgi:catechol 2,3-dioxygenase-like lactoylglutathione lyase family enzyme